MKRFVIAVLLLFCLSLGVLICTAQSLLTDTADVRLTEVTYQGDISAAAGLTVISKNHWRNHLFWTTTHTIGAAAEAETEVEFTASRRYASGGGQSEYLVMQSEILHGIDFTAALERAGVTMGEVSSMNFDLTTKEGTFREFATDPALGIAAAFNALYMDAPIGVEVSATVHLQDYYDYYPITLNLNLPGVIWTNNDVSQDTVAERGTEAYVVQYFRDYFKIPILDEVLEIHLTRSKDSMHWGSASGDSDTYSFYSLSAVNGTDCYFTFGTRTNRDGQIIDTSEIKGGYGIYRLPYRRSTSTADIGVDVDAMEMVYPLEPGTEIEGLYFNNTGTRLILITKATEEQIRIDIIDPETYDCLQTFFVESSSLFNLRIFDDYTVVVTFDKLAVLTEQDGVYTHAFTAVIPKDADGNVRTVTSDYAIAFDGTRLAVANNTQAYYYSGVDKCGYHVTVYSADGVLWSGIVESTLDAGLRKNSYSQDDLTPFYGEHLTLLWK